MDKKREKIHVELEQIGARLRGLSRLIEVAALERLPGQEKLVTSFLAKTLDGYADDVEACRLAVCAAARMEGA